MGITTLDNKDYFGLRVTCMVGGKQRQSYMTFRGKSTAEQSAIMKQAQATHATWLMDQKRAQRATKIKAVPTVRNKTTPVRGISCALSHKVRASTQTYWRFQVGFRKNNVFRSRSVHVIPGQERKAWGKACGILARMVGTSPDRYVERWPGVRSITSAFRKLEAKH